MADFVLAADEIAIHNKTLVPNVEDTVTFPARFQIGDPVLIIHPGGVEPVYVASGAQAATVAGARCRIVFPGNALRLDDVSVVRLISAAAVTYSVEST